jgi:endonuclease III-like uncharacterized protein
MHRINTSRFNRILSRVDNANSFDLESFSQAVLSEHKGIQQETIDNIVDYLVFDIGISCDAELLVLTQKRLKTIISGMNEIIISEVYNEASKQ